MNKKVFLFLLLLSMCIFAGCGEKIKETEEAIDEIVEVINVVQEQPSTDWIPKTKEELLTMELEDFKTMIQENIPNYREFFKISEDMVLTDALWEEIRIIFSLQIFRSATLDTEESEEDSKNIDPNAIYYAPTEEYLRSLSDTEFVEYLAGLQKYLYPDSETVNYNELTTDELNQIKEKFILDIIK